MGHLQDNNNDRKCEWLHAPLTTCSCCSVRLPVVNVGAPCVCVMYVIACVVSCFFRVVVVCCLPTCCACCVFTLLCACRVSTLWCACRCRVCGQVRARSYGTALATVEAQGLLAPINPTTGDVDAAPFEQYFATWPPALQRCYHLVLVKTADAVVALMASARGEASGGGFRGFGDAESQPIKKLRTIARQLRVYLSPGVRAFIPSESQQRLARVDAL